MSDKSQSTAVSPRPSHELYDRQDLDPEKIDYGMATADEKEGTLHVPDHGEGTGEAFSESLKYLNKSTGHVAEGMLERTITVDRGNGDEKVILVDWEENDPENPRNTPEAKKKLQVSTLVFFMGLTATNATCTGAMAPFAVPYFHTTNIGFAVSSFMLLFPIAITPLILAPLSELFGRLRIYQVTAILIAVLFIPQSLSDSYAGLLVARWFQGMASSVANSMVGGSIADLYSAQHRGMWMNLMAIGIFIGSALGTVPFGFVSEHWGVQWVYGIQGIAAGISAITVLLFLEETRSDVLLARRAAKLTKATGHLHLCAAQLSRQSFTEMLKTSAVRPLAYLFTEPIVTAISLWIGFAWGVVFLGTSSTLLVFSQYGWDWGMTGVMQVTMAIGGIIGFISNYHQEYLYRRATERATEKMNADGIPGPGKAAPEARLYWACTGGLLFPIGMFIYAWTGRPEVHWIVPAIFLTLSFWGVYCMYLSVFNYFADAYETYSSSANATQSFARNMFAATFPLFSKQFYNNLGYPIASTVVASIAMVLAAAPIMLLLFGHKLRARSKAAMALAGST